MKTLTFKILLLTWIWSLCFSIQAAEETVISVSIDTWDYVENAKIDEELAFNLVNSELHKKGFEHCEKNQTAILKSISIDIQQIFYSFEGYGTAKVSCYQFR